MILARYIARAMAQGYLLVALVFVALFSFIELIQQLDDVEGAYTLVDAFLYVLMMLPRRLLDATPVIALLGTLVPLGLLADGNEILAMRAAGLPLRRLIGMVLAPGLTLLMLMLLMAQFVAPALEMRAERMRAAALAEDVSVDFRGGFWSRDGRSFLNVGRMLRGRTPSDVTVYDFDDAGRLRRYLHAERASLEQDRVWRLQDVVVKQFEPPPARAQQLAQLDWDSFLDAQQLGVLVVPPQALSPIDLYFYVRDLRARNEQVPQEELRLWQQLAQPLVTLAMMLVAIPLVLGSNRSSTLSRRVLAGTVAGIGLYFVTQTLGYLGLLLHLPAPLTALALPTLILLFAGRLLRRLR
ncbi:LPS export ABC transporter permease LptG [Immundisolibacter sp.]|uniref:LPS export ABC transporter permease LptG n=1 Tax=Immundisolibacter sp. TaxID=1934948 RepID=UPI001986A603|nr:LPS export ABC transporter permease LptG [Immundisolibacter sp.]MBC7160710.1 LPS export ABC transporter permease LptG [Immundisolibacter sp.]MEA3221013.1 Lipopolysaccharide export system permease protein LptG [Immundisolibacter sp.]